MNTITAGTNNGNRTISATAQAEAEIKYDLGADA